MNWSRSDGRPRSTGISRMQAYIVVGALAYLVAVRIGLNRIIAAS